MERNYSVYRLIFPDGKLYFGQTKDIKTRWKSVHMYKGTTFLYDNLLRVGWNNVKKEVIADHLSCEDSRKLEGWLIERYDTTNPENGYNKSKGIILPEDRAVRLKEIRDRGNHNFYQKHKEQRKREFHEFYQSHKEYYADYQRKYTQRGKHNIT